MSAESQIIIGQLKSHIEKIISKYELAVTVNAEMSGELLKCRKELEDKTERIKNLEKKVEELQLAEAFKASSDDVKEAKKKIGRIVREIDKCISMLND